MRNSMSSRHIATAAVVVLLTLAVAHAQTPTGSAINGSAKLAYSVTGRADGTPIVVINGLGMGVRPGSEALTDALVAEGFRVVRFDNRDAGRSTALSERSAREAPSQGSAIAVSAPATALTGRRRPRTSRRIGSGTSCSPTADSRRTRPMRSRSSRRGRSSVRRRTGSVFSRSARHEARLASLRTPAVPIGARRSRSWRALPAAGLLVSPSGARGRTPPCAPRPARPPRDRSAASSRCGSRAGRPRTAGTRNPRRAHSAPPRSPATSR